ncbi:formylglycine-generating enzyme family protein [Aeromonas veronii]|uniref:formylglycine-generating enzyme family protein n=1 Tax=Aeromonas veronii TaxID=654 RepID=UPI0011186644|nr:SUMF1/EgtB/PvdO family nonheme iron enzyme [Aeromonas veronii]MBS4724532.1 SUMF1/EgtB/PvdO family nonheme iron enzyme [Aeromonas veronii]TNI81363.1 sulfatase [Aeromonas veronii]HDO1317485.1 SUMF1/EgtB/PvdO family nonheme iron enzyme [Aeromonas veronii]
MTIIPFKFAIPLLATTLLVAGCTLSVKQGNQPLHPLRQKVEADMVLVEGGRFEMGSNDPAAKASEGPQHTVSLNSFYMAKFEVTQALFEAVMGPSISYFQAPDVPVNNLSWQQANLFVTRLNELTGAHYRLPTEAEWEYAAKGGKLSKGYRYSGSDQIDEVAWYSGNAKNRAYPVGLKKPNELGLYDMTGNVGEFVADAYEETFYRHSPQENPNNAQESKSHLAHKSVRGGSYAYEAELSENFRRDFASQSVMMADMGLRLVRDAR